MSVCLLCLMSGVSVKAEPLVSDVCVSAVSDVRVSSVSAVRVSAVSDVGCVCSDGAAGV